MAAPRRRTTRRSAAVIHAVHPGERLAGYEVGSLLHEGGMARLYRVRAARGRGPLVLKAPKLGAQAPLSALAAFENEARILQRLHGPHAPRVLAVGDTHATPYLVMEYIEGDALAAAARRAPLAVDELCTLGVRLCRAVHELHRQNVIHLDLNPGNVRNRRNGDMVLIDFGMAHHAALPDLLDAAFGEEEGTTAYIAPEQVQHVRGESRSDIYAIGAILYQLATGHYPFGRPNLLSLKRRLLAPPLPPRRHNPALPPWLQEVILRCLEIRPEARYATAKRVAHLLTHPEAVTLTARARRTRPAGFWQRTRLWWRSLYQVFDERAPLRPQERLATSPHVLVALDLTHASEALREALRQAVRRLALSQPHGYFTCLTVMPRAAQAREQAVRLAALHHWAQPLHLPAGRVVFQVIPGEPAGAIVAYARQHVVDHVVLGARGSSRLRRYLGSVSSAVTAQVPCSVTVVRTRRDVPAGTPRGKY
jgi:serine/threonine protein kinase